MGDPRAWTRVTGSFSPENRGFAMADRPRAANVRVTAAAPIDNNPPPSYLSNVSAGSALQARFASNLPEKCRIPERRKLNPAAAA